MADPAEQQLALQLEPAEEEVPPQQCPSEVEFCATDLLNTDTTCALTVTALALCLVVAWCDLVPGGHASASPEEAITKRVINAASIAAARRHVAPPPCKLLALDPPIMAHYLVDTA